MRVWLLGCWKQGNMTMKLNDHDMRTFRQTASAVIRFNKYMHGYTVDQMVIHMLRDAHNFMAECRETGCGYCSTAGYVLSTYYMSGTKQMCCYASVSASLFDE